MPAPKMMPTPPSVVSSRPRLRRRPGRSPPSIAAARTDAPRLSNDHGADPEIDHDGEQVLHDGRLTTVEPPSVQVAADLSEGWESTGDPLTTFPSSISLMRGALAATSRSCVTTMTVSARSLRNA